MGRWQQAQEIEQGAVRLTRWQKSQGLTKSPDEFMQGSIVQKIFDPLLAGQYAVAGLGRKALGMKDAGIKAGVKKRASWIDIVQEKYPYKPTEDWKYNFIQELKRVTPGVAADVVLDPLWIIPPLKMAKMLGITKGIKWAGKTRAIKPIKEALGKGLVYRYGQPKEYAKIAEESIKRITEGGETALDIARPIAKLSKGKQQRIAQVVKGGITTDKEVKALAEPVVKAFQKLGKEAVKEGLLDERTFTKNFGKYMPRLYRTKEMPEGAIKFFGDAKPTRIDISRFKVKQDAPGIIYQQKLFAKSITKKFTSIEARDKFIKELPEKSKVLKKFEAIPDDVLAALGEIKEAGYPSAKGIAQLSQAVERAKFFKEIASNKNWVSKTSKAGFEQLPDTKMLGELSNKYVLKAVFDDIQTIIRRAGKGEELYRKGLGLWKFGKVIANPSTHGRNMMSNAILADMGGLSPVRVDIYGQALVELKTKGKYYKEIKKVSNILSETFYSKEIGYLLDAFDKTKGTNIIQKSLGMTKRLMNKAGNLYQGEEQWSKMALYIAKRKKGLSPEAAAKEAERWLFDYSKVPPLIEHLRGTRGMSIFAGAYPFATFSYKALPRMAETALTKTPRLTKWMKMKRGVEELSPEEETKAERAVLPEYMKEGMYMKLPIKDKYGRSQYLDLNYILPWGDIGEVGHTLYPSNPVWSLIADLKRNKSGFTKREIWKPGSTEEDISKAIVDYVGKAALPPLLFGYSWDKFWSMAKQTPDWNDRVRGFWATMIDITAGLKTRPIDVKEETEWREYEKQKDIRDVQARIRSILRRKDISEEEKKRLEAEYQKKLENLGGKTPYVPTFIKEKTWRKSSKNIERKPSYKATETPTEITRDRFLRLPENPSEGQIAYEIKYLQDRGDILKKAPPQFTVRAIIDLIRDKLPFLKSSKTIGTERALKREVIERYNFTDIAKKEIEKMDIRDASPIIEPVLGLIKEGRGIKPYGGKYSPMRIDELKKFGSMVYGFEKKEFIENVDLKQNITAHEMLHHFWDTVVPSKEELLYQEFGEKWEEYKSKDDRLAEYMQGVDDTLDNNPLYEGIGDWGRDNERFAYFGADWGMFGLENIPKEFQIFYSTWFK